MWDFYVIFTLFQPFSPVLNGQSVKGPHTITTKEHGKIFFDFNKSLIVVLARGFSLCLRLTHSLQKQTSLALA